MAGRGHRITSFRPCPARGRGRSQKPGSQNPGGGLTDVHDEAPHHHDPAPDGAVDVPEPDGEEEGVVRLVAELGAQLKEPVPEPAGYPVEDEVVCGRPAVLARRGRRWRGGGGGG